MDVIYVKRFCRREIKQTQSNKEIQVIFESTIKSICYKER